MADMIARLKLESGEFDSKIKRATQGLLQMEQECRGVGGTLAILEKDQLEFVKSLGQMQTVSKSAKGSLSELTSAYTELSMQYKRLTDEEKNGDFGKALRGSLDQLKARIDTTKTDLADVTRELNGTGGFMDALTSKLTVNIDAMKLFDMGLKAAGAALDVAKDAFFASEANVDEWGRTIASAQSVYEGFLTAINTGDISGFLGNIDSIVTAARAAYDELDKLGTMKTIQSPQISAQQTEIERMRAMLRTGRYIDAGDGRKSSEGYKAGDLLSDDTKRRIEQKLENGIKSLGSLIGNEIKQTGNAIEALYNNQAKRINIPLEEFKKGTSSWSEFTKRLEGAEQYRKWEAEHTQTVIDTTTGVTNGIRFGGPNPYAQYKNWADFRVDKDGSGTFKELVDYIRQRDQQRGQLIGLTAQSYQAINRVEGIRPRIGGGASRTENIIKEITPLQEAQRKIADLSNEALTADELRRAVIKEEIADLQKQVDEYKKIQDYVTGKTQFVDPTHVAASDPTKAGFSIVQNEALMDEDKVMGLSLKMVQTLQSEFQAGMQSVDIGTPLFEKMQALFTDSTSLSTLIKTAIDNGLNVEGLDFTGLQEQIAKGIDVPDSAFEDLITKIDEQLEALDLPPIAIDFKTGNLKGVSSETKTIANTAKEAGQAFSQLGSAISSIEDPGAKVAGLVMQAIGNTAAAFGAAQLQAATQEGPWAWIAFAVTGLATMISTISGIKSATAGSYEEGGIVPGNSWSGDRLTANVNSGELILSRSQQDNLAMMLEAPAQVVNNGADVRVSADVLRLTLKNGARKRGMTMNDYLNL